MFFVILRDLPFFWPFCEAYTRSYYTAVFRKRWYSESGGIGGYILKKNHIWDLKIGSGIGKRVHTTAVVLQCPIF